MELSNSETKILKYLLTTPQGTSNGVDVRILLGYFDTSIENLYSSLEPLIKIGYVNKRNNSYTLTLNGRNYLERRRSSLKRKVVWSIWVPLFVAIVSSVITTLLVESLTK